MYHASCVHLWQTYEMRKDFDRIIESRYRVEIRTNEADMINKGPKCAVSMRIINHSGSSIKIERRAKRDLMEI